MEQTSLSPRRGGGGRGRPLPSACRARRTGRGLVSRCGHSPALYRASGLAHGSGALGAAHAAPASSERAASRTSGRGGRSTASRPPLRPFSAQRPPRSQNRQDSNSKFPPGARLGRPLRARSPRGGGRRCRSGAAARRRGHSVNTAPSLLRRPAMCGRGKSGGDGPPCQQPTKLGSAPAFLGPPAVSRGSDHAAPQRGVAPGGTRARPPACHATTCD